MKFYKFYFVYKTTNLINGKFYVGSHCTDKLNDGYLGSGKILCQSIKKHGKQNFKREILNFCTNKDVLCTCEEFWIKELKAVKLGYNLVYNSDGGYINEETYERFSREYKGRKNNPEQHIKITATKTKNGTLNHSEKTKLKIKKTVNETYKDPVIRNKCSLKGEKNGFYKKKHTEETCEKIRQLKLGKKLSLESIIKREKTRKLNKLKKLNNEIQ